MCVCEGGEVLIFKNIESFDDACLCTNIVSKNMHVQCRCLIHFFQCSCLRLRKHFILYFVDLILKLSEPLRDICLRFRTRVVIEKATLFNFIMLSFFFLYLLIYWVHYFFLLFIHIVCKNLEKSYQELLISIFRMTFF